MKIQTETQFVQREKKSRMKWLILGAFCLNTMINLLPFTSIFPIWMSIVTYYNTTSYDLNWFNNCYYIGPSVFAFIFNPLILYKFGLSQIISCACTAVGLWIIVFGGNSFFYGQLGYSFLGLGIAFLAHIPLHVSKLYFEPQERILSTFLGQYSNNFGMFLGYIISTIYFQDVIEEEEFNTKYQTMCIVFAILASISFVVNFITLKDPQNGNEKIQLRLSYKESLNKIITAQESLIDFLSISFFIGLSWCYALFLEIQQYDLGQDDWDVKYVNITFMIGQMCAGTYCTIKLVWQSKEGYQLTYDKYIKVTLSFGFLFLTFELLFLEQIPAHVLIAINFFIGAGLGGLWSVMLESLMEKYYPIQEIAIGYTLCSCANVVAITFTMILLLPQFVDIAFQISCCGMIAPFCSIVVRYQTLYKRFEFES